MNPGPAAILGNGSLLVTLSAHARVERLFWPQLDRGSHLGELRFGLELDGVTRWLDEEEPEEQSYFDDASIVRTRTGGVEVVDLVHEHEPVLFRRVSAPIAGAALVVHCRPELDGSARSLAASVQGDYVVFYRRDVALAIGARGARAARRCVVEGNARSRSCSAMLSVMRVADPLVVNWADWRNAACEPFTIPTTNLKTPASPAASSAL